MIGNFGFSQSIHRLFEGADNGERDAFDLESRIDGVGGPELLPGERLSHHRDLGMSYIVLIVEEPAGDQDQVANLPVLGRTPSTRMSFTTPLPKPMRSCICSMGEE